MCGLAGILDPDSAREVDRGLLRRMTRALAHRGPDGEGFHVEPGLGLGHRRLAIIDPREGQQPMQNEDGSVVLVFNGMIYNFQDLTPELRARGHVFRTRCDTETIIHAWEEWGPDCLARLDGMFALALWDRSRRTLFLARDRLGKKPLYHASLPDGRFVFASEMAALRQVAELPRGLSAGAVEDFLAYGYIPDPATIYSGVHRLSAAHCLALRQGEAVGAPRRYWRPAAAPRTSTEAEAVAELSGRLRAATAARLVSDVPLGAFLSGGVDSAGVVAVAASLRDSPLDTFTIGFEGAEDETPYAEMVARRYGTRQHNERAAAIDMIGAARLQGRVFGEPFGDPSSVPTHLVCGLARRHATVAISGDGGDEAFAGYRRYRFHSLAQSARALLPAPARRRVLGELARLYPKLDRAPRWLRAKATLTELSLDAALGYFRTVARVQDEGRRALLSPGLRAALDGHDPAARMTTLMAESGTEDALAQAQYADLQTWLSGGILVKVDRASMAHSLEVRAPLLDHRLVEWGLSLPARLKLRAGSGKHVLKRALRPL
ncbi:MAG: asparagine synthase (glutamine-hydrolyzing), partial [Acetobacteraceae bacterium]|nr:asparagine synthase (glutamine-hydrolyzing) [Acetobacteraceae bacterium]